MHTPTKELGIRQDNRVVLDHRAESHGLGLFFQHSKFVIKESRKSWQSLMLLSTNFLRLLDKSSKYAKL